MDPAATSGEVSPQVSSSSSSSQHSKSQSRSRLNIWALLLALATLFAGLNLPGYRLTAGPLRRPTVQNWSDRGVQELLKDLPEEYIICTETSWRAARGRKPSKFDGSTASTGPAAQLLEAVKEGVSDVIESLFVSRDLEEAIYTLKNDSPGEVECLHVDSGKVVESGSVEAIVPRMCLSVSDCTLDLRLLPRGHSIQPSFIDAHLHLLDLGHAIHSVDVSNATSLAQVVEILGVYAANDKGGDINKWIVGGGWDHTRWDDFDSSSSFPTMHDMISAVPALEQRKIALKRVDFHAYWLSPAAVSDMIHLGHLKLERPEPQDGQEEIQGGLITRDPKSGHPTGIFIDNAMNLVTETIPPWTEQDRELFLATAAELLLSVGITGVGDAAVGLDDLDFLIRKAAIDGPEKLPIRVYAFLACPPETRNRCYNEAQQRLSHLLPESAQLPFTNTRAESMLTLRTVKLFADGALGSWGAAMLEPYSDRPDGEKGLLLLCEAQLADLTLYWHDKGFQVATHAIGDRANQVVVDAYKHALFGSEDVRDGDVAISAIQDARLRIEHSQLLPPALLESFKDLNILPSVQPIHLLSDAHYLSSRLGESRPSAIDGAYPWGSLLSHGARLVFGSDAPVETPDPRISLYAALHRIPRGFNESYQPSQRIPNAYEAIKAYTLNAAYAQFQEDVLGSLESGKWADWILVKGDFFQSGPALQRDPRDSHVLGAAIGGKWAWRQ